MKYKVIKTLLIVCIGLVILTPKVDNTKGEDNETNIVIEETTEKDNDENKTDIVPKDEETDKTENIKKEDETKASDETVKEDSNKQTEETKQEEVKEESEKIEVETEVSSDYTEYSIPSNSGFKSYMSYKSITSTTSYQYKLQHQYAYTGNYGIRQVDGRYCIAIGTFSNAKIGTYVDLILENGTVIPCIVGDFKAPVHTDSSNIITLHNGCVSEFIVDINNLHSTAKKMGNVSYCEDSWKSPVKAMKIYNTNVFGM